MASINSLPNELVLRILELASLEDLDLQDLENLALSCRHFYTAAQPSLNVHRKLARRFHWLRQIGFAREALPTFLKAVLDNPAHGRYVKTIEISPLAHGSTDQETGGDLAVHHIKSLRHAAKVSPFFLQCLNDDDNDDDWWDDFSPYQEDGSLAILLPMLPNLSTLNLGYDFGNEDIGFDNTATFDAFRALESSPILQALQTINLSFAPGVYADCLEVLGGLPCLRDLSATNVSRDADCGPSRRDWKLNSLALWDCNLSSREVFDYIRRFGSLESFHLSEYLKTDLHRCEKPSSFEPFLIRSACLAYSADTLQNLTILGTVTETHDPSIGPLTEFKVLKELPVEFCNLFDICDDRTFYDLDVIPNTLRKLTLRNPPPESRAILEYLHNHLPSGPPQLKSLVFARDIGTSVLYPGYWEWPERFAKLGICLEICVLQDADEAARRRCPGLDAQI